MLDIVITDQGFLECTLFSSKTRHNIKRLFDHVHNFYMQVAFWAVKYLMDKQNTFEIHSNKTIP